MVKQKKTKQAFLSFLRNRIGSLFENSEQQAEKRREERGKLYEQRPDLWAQESVAAEFHDIYTEAIKESTETLDRVHDDLK